MPVDPNDLKVIASVPSEIEATEIAAAIEDLGIRAVVSGGLTSGFKAAAPGDVKVLVKHADAGRAEQAILEIRDRGDVIDWSKVNVGEPEFIEAAGGPYSTILWGTIAGILAAAVVTVVVGGSDVEMFYKSKGFWGAVILCAFTSALCTAKTAFALGQRTRVDASAARIDERDVS